MLNSGENLNRAALAFVGFSGPDVARYYGLDLLQKLYIAGLGLHHAKSDYAESLEIANDPFSELLTARSKARLKICSSGFLQVANRLISQPVRLEGEHRILMHKCRYNAQDGYFDDWSAENYSFDGKTEITALDIEDRSDSPLIDNDGYPVYYFGKVAVNSQQLYVPLDINPNSKSLTWSRVN